MSFAEALVDRSLPVPNGLVIGHRFRVYRNNVTSALTKALAVRYPQVKRLVGDQFFAAMAGAFALSSPPCSAALIFYGDEFPEFVAQFAPAQELAPLGDVARLESAWWRAYHAAEARPVEPSAFVAIAPNDLASLVLTFHPSYALVSSPYPIASLWQDDAAGIAAAKAERVLLCRPEAEVIVRVVGEDSAAFVAELARGETLGAAVELMISRFPDFDLQAQLMGLISLHIVTRLTIGEKQ